MIRISVAVVLAALCFHAVESIAADVAGQGLYTAAQAEKGKAQYDTRCAQCHGADLLGIERASPLVGLSFLGNWNGQSVGDLVERIRTTMPADDPGTLSRATSTDITAFILSSIGMPAGAADLPRDAQIQQTMRIQGQAR